MAQYGFCLNGNDEALLDDRLPQPRNIDVSLDENEIKKVYRTTS